jgi:hypothetical protein
MTMDAATGRLLRVASEIVPGQRLRTRLQRGTVESSIAGAKGGILRMEESA